jgi:hypothetical protein
MKMRNTLLSIVVVVGLCGLQSQMKADCTYNMEISNKSSGPIEVTLKLGEKIYNKETVGNGKQLALNSPLTGLNGKSAVQLIIKDPTVGGTSHRFELINLDRTTDPRVYLTWWGKNGTTLLAPQQGSFLSSTTERGCLKANNIKASDIKYTGPCSNFLKTDEKPMENSCQATK